MLRRTLYALSVALLLALAIGPGIASAHQTVQVGAYDVEYGWINEPVIVNQPNAIVINIAPHAASTATPAPGTPENIDISGLKVEAVYGGETKALTLQPLGENTPGQFVAPLLPTRMGQITIRLSGKIGTTDIQPVEVQPEEIQGSDLVAFPKVVATPASTGLGTESWLGLGGLVFGLIGTLLGAVALLRRK